MIIKFINVAVYRINLYKSIAFFLPEEQTYREKDQVPTSVHNSLKENKTFEINLTKELKDLYNKNFKLLKKYRKTPRKKWKDILCSWIGKINIVNDYFSRSHLPIQSIPIKIPISLSTEIEKNIKINMEPEKTPKSQNNPQQKNKAERISNSDLKIYYRNAIVKTM